MRWLFVLLLTGCADLVNKDELEYKKEVEIYCKGECTVKSTDKIEEDTGANTSERGTARIITP